MTYADCISYARAAISNNQPFVLLGESFSGPVAVALAGERPAALKGLILCASFLRCPSRLLRALRPLIAIGPAVRPPASLMAAFLLGRFETTELRERMMKAVAKVPALTLKQRLLAIATVDASRHLADIAVPRLCLRASEDRLVAATIPGNQVVELVGPHFLLQANPTDAAAAIAAFIQSRE
jgi:pimeloyl-ACP methyl ester carboxylesterase